MRYLYPDFDELIPCGLSVSSAAPCKVFATFPRMRGTMRVVNWRECSVGSGLAPSIPLPPIAYGAEEVRVADDTGAYCVIYFARRAGAVYVLHAFQKRDSGYFAAGS